MTRASCLFFLKPVIAALLAIAILRDTPTGLQVVAILVVPGCVIVEFFWPPIAARRDVVRP